MSRSAMDTGCRIGNQLCGLLEHKANRIIVPRAYLRSTCGLGSVPITGTDSAATQTSRQPALPRL